MLIDSSSKSKQLFLLKMKHFSSIHLLLERVGNTFNQFLTVQVSTCKFKNLPALSKYIYFKKKLVAALSGGFVYNAFSIVAVVQVFFNSHSGLTLEFGLVSFLWDVIIMALMLMLLNGGHCLGNSVSWLRRSHLQQVFYRNYLFRIYTFLILFMFVSMKQSIVM